MSFLIRRPPKSFLSHFHVLRVLNIVAWNVVRSGTGDGFGYVIRRLVENQVCESPY